jgi:DinB superfamily
MDSRLEKLQQVIGESLVDSASEKTGTPAPGKWSAAELLEHLYLTYTATTKGFERVAAAGKSLATSSTWPQRLRTFVVVGCGYMPDGAEAPAVSRPRGVPAEQVRAEIIPAIQKMDEVIGRCEAAVGSDVKILDHPILGPLTVMQWIKLHLVHGKHHAEQIRRLRRAGNGNG